MNNSASATASRVAPLVARTRDELRTRLGAARQAGNSIGLVPTMGALHAGHLSLVEVARRQCDFTVATIFVNPTQFAPHEDFASYPRTLDADLQSLGAAGVDLVFAPATEEMYRPGDGTFVEVGSVAKPLEGECRPGHFRGVATIVLKLFNLVAPDAAYFGRKDYQQALVIRRMVEDLDLPIRIEVCPIVREPDGLALSSRNVYLSPDEHRSALAISQSLRLARQLVGEGTRDAATLERRMLEHLRSAGVTQIDYAVVVDAETLERVGELRGPAVALIAAKVGKTRLIDNELIG